MHLQVTLLTQSPLHATQFNLAGVTILLSEPATDLGPQDLIVTNAIITNFTLMYVCRGPQSNHLIVPWWSPASPR
jgi:hypothetical protein